MKLFVLKSDVTHTTEFHDKYDDNGIPSQVISVVAYVTVSNVYPGPTHQSFRKCDLTSSLWNIADGFLKWRQPTES